MSTKPKLSNHEYVLNLVLSAMFLAMGLLLPFLTGQIKEIGSMLLPMHIPVLLCGLICGWSYGGSIGIILPILRNMLFGMPPMPGAISMAFELCTYGIVIGIVSGLFKKKNVLSIVISLVSAMIAGRIVWGIAQYIVLGINGGSFTFKAFMAGAILNAVPGMILQIILIPTIMLLLMRTKVIKK